MHLDLALVILFSVATAVALAARWLKVPYTVALVLTGLAIGVIQWRSAPHLSKELLFAVFLPGLLFEAAFHIDAKKLWANRLTVPALAVPGVVAAIAFTAFLITPVIQGLHLESRFRLLDGLVFGGIVAATDPIAVVALFKTLGAPKRLGILIEGESLLNDGTAVVLFGAIVTVAGGTDVTVAGASLDFVRTCGIGVLVGAGLGYGGSRVIHMVDDAMIEITVTVVLAWGSFAIAEQVHASGVLATVTAGLLCGNDGARTGMSPTTKIAAITFWEYVAFALNSIVFLLIGLEVELMAVLLAWKAVLLAWFATTAARAVVIGGVSLLLRRSRERLPRGWATVMCWGGIRGGLSMVLVLALPAAFAHRQFLVNTVFGVVLVSILLQGLTIGPLLRRLQLIKPTDDRVSYERARGRILAARAALDELAVLGRARGTPKAILDELRLSYEARIADAEAAIHDLRSEDHALDGEERARVVRHLLHVEKERLLRAVQEGLTSDEAVGALVAELDARWVHGDEVVAKPADLVDDKPA